MFTTGPSRAVQLDLSKIRSVTNLHGQSAVLAFTDIDGTANNELLPESERHNSLAPAKRAIHQLQIGKVPVGIVTGRSYGEAAWYAKELGCLGPIICEDGAVLAFPTAWTKYLSNQTELPFKRQDDGSLVLILSSINRERIQQFLDFVSKSLPHDTHIISSLEGGATLFAHGSGHPNLAAAERSAMRLASAYMIKPEKEVLDILFKTKTASDWGMRCFAPNLPHVIGLDAHKGLALRKACEITLSILRTIGVNAKHITPIAFGNNDNDIALFREIDKMGGIGILVAHPDAPAKSFISTTEIPNSTIICRQSHGLGMIESLAYLERSLAGE